MANATALIQLMRPKNILLAALTVPLGALFGLQGAIDANQAGMIAVQILAVLTFMGAGNAMNDIKDAAIDVHAHPQRPIPSGRVSKIAAQRFVWVLWAVSVSLMLIGVWLLSEDGSRSWPILLIYGLAALLMLTYDLGPEMKSKGLVGNISISLMVAAVIVYGASSVDAVNTLVLWVAGVVFFTNLAREIVKDCQDILADEGERETLPMKIGTEQARMLAYILILAGLVCLYVPYWKGPFDFGQLLFQAPAMLVLITLNGPLFKGDDVVTSARIRVSMLLGLLGFILTMYF